MKTFGLAMIIGNLAFVPPEWTFATVALLTRPLARLFARPAGSAAIARAASDRHSPAKAVPA
jgi:hypothetical protein